MQRILSRSFTTQSAYAVLSLAVILVLISSVVCAQSSTSDWQAKAGGKMQFDAASVKRNTAGLPPSGPPPRSNVVLNSDDSFTPAGGLLRATNIPLTTYISFAYKLNLSQTLVLSSQAAHTKGLEWTLGYRWDIDARASDNATKDQLRLMMQSLLADRFKLSVHKETKELPVYALELVTTNKPGPQLQARPTDLECVNSATAQQLTNQEAMPKCGVTEFSSPKPGRNRLAGRAVTVEQIIDRLGVNAPEQRPVIDRTGLSGKFDFSIEWAPEYRGPLPPGYPQPDPTAPTFLEALKEQLGLKLDPTTGAVGVLVIDHVEEPSPN